MIREKNRFSIKALMKFLFFISLGVFVFTCCNNKKDTKLKNAEVKCFNVRELMCEVADIPFDNLNYKIERSKNFNIVTDIHDLGGYELSNGVLLKGVLEGIAKSSETKQLRINYCVDDSIDFKGDLILTLSDAHIYEDYMLTYCRLHLNEKEYIEFNFLYFEDEIIFTDCATIFLIEGR